MLAASNSASFFSSTWSDWACALYELLLVSETSICVVVVLMKYPQDGPVGLWSPLLNPSTTRWKSPVFWRLHFSGWAIICLASGFLFTPSDLCNFSTLESDHSFSQEWQRTKQQFRPNQSLQTCFYQVMSLRLIKRLRYNLSSCPDLRFHKKAGNLREHHLLIPRHCHWKR